MATWASRMYRLQSSSVGGSMKFHLRVGEGIGVPGGGGYVSNPKPETFQTRKSMAFSWSPERTPPTFQIRGSTQKVQYPSIGEYALNHDKDP